MAAHLRVGRAEEHVGNSVAVDVTSGGRRAHIVRHAEHRTFAAIAALLRQERLESKGSGERSRMSVYEIGRRGSAIVSARRFRDDYVIDAIRVRIAGAGHRV